MKCDKCGKEVASVHIVKVVKGQKIETWLCSDCAKEDQELGMLKSLGTGEISVDEMLNGLIDYINEVNNAAPKEEKNLQCSNCGLTYNEFKKSGMLGCSECYKSFEQYLVPGIEELQGSKQHIGHVPQRIGKNVILKRKIKELSEKLKKLVDTEEYEKAAVVRDELKVLQEKEN